MSVHLSSSSSWRALACPHPGLSASALNTAADEGGSCVPCAVTADGQRGGTPHGMACMVWSSWESWVGPDRLLVGGTWKPETGPVAAGAAASWVTWGCSGSLVLCKLKSWGQQSTARGERSRGLGRNKDSMHERPCGPETQPNSPVAFWLLPSLDHDSVFGKPYFAWG